MTDETMMERIIRIEAFSKKKEVDFAYAWKRGEREFINSCYWDAVSGTERERNCDGYLEKLHEIPDSKMGVLLGVTRRGFPIIGNRRPRLKLQAKERELWIKNPNLTDKKFNEYFGNNIYEALLGEKNRVLEKYYRCIEKSLEKEGFSGYIAKYSHQTGKNSLVNFAKDMGICYITKETVREGYGEQLSNIQESFREAMNYGDSKHIAYLTGEGEFIGMYGFDADNVTERSILQNNVLRKILFCKKENTTPEKILIEKWGWISFQYTKLELEETERTAFILPKDDGTQQTVSMWGYNYDTAAYEYIMLHKELKQKYQYLNKKRSIEPEKFLIKYAKAQKQEYNLEPRYFLPNQEKLIGRKHKRVNYYLREIVFDFQECKQPRTKKEKQEYINNTVRYGWIVALSAMGVKITNLSKGDYFPTVIRKDYNNL